ncbi:MAG: hypothetical protein IID33_14835, partial [Planctomycetes bacterium]|nr:hypothetical protein [Planctomycetota bacterium]
TALNDLAWCTYETAASTADYEAALAIADRGVKLAPENPYLPDTRGEILAKLPGRLDDARTDFQKRLELVAQDDSARAETLRKLAGICLDLNDAEAGQRHLDELERIHRNNSDAISDQERELLAKLQQRVAKEQGGRGGG